MNKIRAYVIAQGADELRLQDAVSELINKNFQPFGNLVILQFRDGDDYQCYEYNQPMVKYKEI